MDAPLTRAVHCSLSVASNPPPLVRKSLDLDRSNEPCRGHGSAVKVEVGGLLPRRQVPATGDGGERSGSGVWRGMIESKGRVSLGMFRRSDARGTETLRRRPLEVFWIPETMMDLGSLDVGVRERSSKAASADRVEVSVLSSSRMFGDGCASIFPSILVELKSCLSTRLHR